MSRSAAANLRGGRSRLCENSRPLADSDNVASVKCMLMRTAKRIVAFLVSIGASKLPLTTQNPSQSGPRTQDDGRFRTRGAAFAISITAAGEESSAIRASCWVGRRGGPQIYLSGDAVISEFACQPRHQWR